MAARQEPTRTALIVLGMHRSGTSALAGVLAAMGAVPPQDLLDADPMNPAGFFESAGLSELDDRFMNELGTSWFDWRPMPSAWAESALARDFRATVQGHLRAAFSEESLFVFKDPRLCRLAPLWTDILRDAGCRPVIVGIHRDPHAVAASLEHWAGYDPSYGRLLWLRYVLDGERATRGESRMFCSYGQVLTDWRTVVSRVAETAEIDWPRGVVEVEGQVDAFLGRRAETPRPKPDGVVPMSPWEEAAYNVLERWTATGEDPADHATLDAVTSALDSASRNLGLAIDAGRAADISRRQLATSTGELERMVSGLRAELDAAESHLRQLISQVSERDALVARLNEEMADLHAEEHRLREEVDRLGRECRLLERQASAEMRTRIGEAFEELEDVRQLLARREKQIAAIASQRDQLLESRSWRATRPVRAVSGFARRVLVSDSKEASS